MQIRVLCEPEEAKILIFNRFLSLNRTSVRQSSSWTVPFIVGIARLANAMPGSVREGPDPSTGLGSGHPAALFLMRQSKTKRGRVPYGMECGPGCRCRIRSPLMCGTAPFYGTRARADARIRTLVPDPRLNPQTAYRIFTKAKL